MRAAPASFRGKYTLTERFLPPSSNLRVFLYFRDSWEKGIKSTEQNPTFGYTQKAERRPPVNLSLSSTIFLQSQRLMCEPQEGAPTDGKEIPLQRPPSYRRRQRIQQEISQYRISQRFYRRYEGRKQKTKKKLRFTWPRAMPPSKKNRNRICHRLSVYWAPT